jgi:histidinol-phosphate/aromatic aminotransferase/cobyric acid decarboxylase-like protein
VIVLRTFSKSYSLAGARLGLLFAAPALIAHLEKVRRAAAGRSGAAARRAGARAADGGRRTD